MPTVIPDHAAVGRMVGRYLMDAGHRHFAFCAQTGEARNEKRMAESVTREFREHLGGGGFQVRRVHGAIWEANGAGLGAEPPADGPLAVIAAEADGDVVHL